MNTSRKTAIVVGVLFIIGTVSGVLSLGFLGSLDDPDYLVQVFANEDQIIIGTLFILIMGFALAMVPVVLFPVFEKYKSPGTWLLFSEERLKLLSIWLKQSFCCCCCRQVRNM